jgi:hypothetical protein
MKKIRQDNVTTSNIEALSTELLILPDGRILVQNLTQPMADVLSGLNPKDETIRSRARIPAAVVVK